MLTVIYKRNLIRLLSIVLVLQMIALQRASVNAQQPPPPDAARDLLQTGVSVLPGKEKRWALIIGVDKYEDGGISPLRGAANDARALASALQTYAGFPESQTILLTTDEPRERQPTRQNILRRLSNLKGLVPRDGLLLISFSGHGIERDGQAFLIPSDAAFTEDVSLLEETALSVERMRNQIRATQVQQVLILLDACRNDPASGKADSSNPLTDAYRRGFSFDLKNRDVAAFATLYATSIGSRAYEYSEKRQGYFSWAVVEALSGKAANRANGEVSLGNLIRYVEDAVPRQVAIDLGVARKQKPFAVVEGYKADELILSIGKINAETPPDAASKTRIDAATVEREFWDSIKNSADADDFKLYKEKFPNGSYAAIADLKIRQLARRQQQKQPPSPQKTAPKYSRDACEAIYKKYLDNYKGTLEQRKIALAGGEEFLEKCEHPETTEIIDYLKNKLPALKKKITIEEDIGLFSVITRDPGNINADEVFAVGKEILEHSPDLIDVMLVMASIGFDKAAASSPVDAYNADTIKYAKEAIQKIEAGAASTQYGAWSYTYKTKGNAVGWMNYIIGYIMYTRQNIKKEALPFLYKAAQNASELKKQSIPYQLIGDYYKDEYNRIDDQRATLASEAKGKTPEEIKPLADKAKELLRLQKAYAERVFDAYARAYILADKDKTYRDALYNSLKILYMFLFDGKIDGLDEYIIDITNKPPQNPAQEVTVNERQNF